MAGMRLVPVLLLLLAGLVGGCAGDDAGTGSGPGADAPTSGPGRPTSAPPPADAEALPPAVAAVCRPFAEMADAIKDATVAHAGPDDVAVAIAPVLKEFAALLPRLKRPPGMPASTWRGLQALARRILDLPDRPTNARIEAVERQLTPQQRDAVAAAADWFKTRCRL